MPAAIVLVCGVFGNIVDRDVESTVRALPTLCDDGASVLWTRHTRAPDLTPTIRRWFAESGFQEEAFDALEGTSVGVGMHRFVNPPEAFEPGRRLFRFVGYDQLLGGEG